MNRAALNSDNPFCPPSASIETLKRRAQLLQQIRKFFDRRGFFEVQTPVLSRDTVVDRFIDPLSVELEPGKPEPRRWLQTSPEFLMKRLLVAGADHIYQIGPVFRGGEQGRLHNVEFTMLEWYRVGDDYEQGIDLLDDFARELLQIAAARRISYREAFQIYAGIDPFDQTSVDQATRARRLSTANHAANNHLASWDHDENLNWLLAECVEPRLSEFESVIIYDWPASQSALAKIRETDGIAVAERFELYVRGIELANGYHELTDAKELLARNRSINRLRQSDGRGPLPETSELLVAMKHGLPDCCGVALGLDRFFMLALGKDRISEVMAFDGERA